VSETVGITLKGSLSSHWSLIGMKVLKIKIGLRYTADPWYAQVYGSRGWPLWENHVRSGCTEVQARLLRLDSVFP
jgi:hypothetical protein